MSLSRQFFRELRPLFRMFEEPIRAPTAFSRQWPREFLDDPWLGAPMSSVRVPVDVSEDGNYYVIEAELPGVKKEDVDVRVADGGRTVTIEGKIVQRSANASEHEGAADSVTAASTETDTNTTDVVNQQNQRSQLSVERAFTGSTHFTRTIGLPRPVDTTGVTAKLVDGVLTLRVPKAEDKKATKISVE